MPIIKEPQYRNRTGVAMLDDFTGAKMRFNKYYIYILAKQPSIVNAFLYFDPFSMCLDRALSLDTLDLAIDDIVFIFLALLPIFLPSFQFIYHVGAIFA